MNIGDLTDDEIQMVFVTYCAKLMLQAKARGNSMAVIEIDPKVIFKMPVEPGKEDAGMLTIAVAGGPSRHKLMRAFDLVSIEN